MSSHVFVPASRTRLIQAVEDAKWARFTAHVPMSRMRRARHARMVRFVASVSYLGMVAAGAATIVMIIDRMPL